MGNLYRKMINFGTIKALTTGCFEATSGTRIRLDPNRLAGKQFYEVNLGAFMIAYHRLNMQLHTGCTNIKCLM